MAENILIGPEAVPVSGRVVRIRPESARLAGAQAGTQQLAEAMRALTGSAIRQEEVNNSTNAYISYKNKLTDLEDQMDQVRDFDTRLRLHQVGLDKIKEDITQEFPGLRPNDLKSIEVGMANDRREYNHKVIAERWTAGEKDFKANLAMLNRLAVKSISDNDRNLLVARAHRDIESAFANGYISEQQQVDQKYLFDYAVQNGKLQDLVNSNPEYISLMKDEDFKQDPKDIWELKRKANLAIADKYKTATIASKEAQLEAEEAVKKDPSLLNDPNWRTRVRPAFLKEHTRYLTEPEVKAQMDYMKTIEDPDQLEQYYVNKVLPLATTTTDHLRLSTDYGRDKTNLADFFHKYTRNRQHQLDEDINLLEAATAEPKFAGVGMTDPGEAAWRKYMSERVGNIPDLVKNTGEVDQQYEKLKKEIQEHYTELGKKPGAKPAPTLPPTPPTAPPPPPATPPPIAETYGHAPGDVPPVPTDIPPPDEIPHPEVVKASIEELHADDREKRMLELISKMESDYRNVPNFMYNPKHTAQGIFQITNSNWHVIAPSLGITAKSAMEASYKDQARVALVLLRNKKGRRNWTDDNPDLRIAFEKEFGTA